MIQHKALTGASGLFYLNIMGLFSGNKKTHVSPTLGEFKLVFSNGSNRIWANRNSPVHYVLRGTDEMPFPEQLSFLEKADEEIKKLNLVIGDYLKKEFQTNFDQWKERFKITSLEVMEKKGNVFSWNIYFEDLNKKSFRFTLFMEGETVLKVLMDED